METPEKHPPSDDFASYFRGLLDAHEASALEAHVAACDACAARLRGEARVELAMHEASEDAARERARRAEARRKVIARASLVAVAALIAAASVALIRTPPRAPQAPIGSAAPSCTEGASCADASGKDPTMSRKAISAALLALTPIAPVFACSSAPPSDASSVAAPASADFAPGPLPRDWIASGGDREAYALGTDPAMRRDERAALTLQSKRATPSFGTVMTMADAASYRGKRVRLRGAMRSDDVRGKGGLWMRVDGPEGTSSLAFDNMFDRPVCGTTEWHTYDVVLDVSPDAQKIAYGVLLQGEGRLWADSLALEAVGTDVATTDLARPTVRGAGGIGASPAWFGAGSAPRKYEMSADANVRRGEGASITLRAKGSPQGDDFGTLMQDMDARSFRGKRAHFSAFVRARDVGDWAGIWMRVDDAKGKTLAFDNMEDRPIKGTSEWRRYEVVLDVPKEAARVDFGVLLVGEGQVWMDSVALTAE